MRCVKYLLLSLQCFSILTTANAAAATSNDGRWIQMGLDIDGENEQDFAGGTQNALAMNSIGTTIAVGASGHDGNLGRVENSGHVRVFDWVTTTTTTDNASDDGSTKEYYWKQRGSDIQGEYAKDLSGSSVVLSHDGKVVAIGEPYSDAGHRGQFEKDYGQVRVFVWKDRRQKWVPRGGPIRGVNPYDHLSDSQGLAMNGNGSTIVVGASNYRPKDEGLEEGYNKGHARVFDWDDSIEDWVQRGSDMIGEAAGDWFGHSVAINDTGDTVAVGALFNDGDAENGRFSCVTCRGSVRVFDWNTENKEWMQRGDDLDGEQDYDFSGSSLSLNGVGDVVAVGSPQTNAPYGHPERGAVTVYGWNGSAWQNRGDRIEGEADGDISGSTVVLSSSGDEIAVGAYLNDGSSDTEGHVRVYDWDDATSSWRRKGDDIDGENKYDYSGYSLAMSADGNVLASGARYTDDGAGYFAGHARVFRWQPDDHNMEPCKDDSSWKFNGVKKQDCGWVSVKRSKRCDLLDQPNGVKAKDACPLACKNKKDNCLKPNCWKNSQWHPKDGSFNSCKDLNSMTKKERKSACAKIGVDKVTFGYEACAKCKKCQKVKKTIA